MQQTGAGGHPEIGAQVEDKRQEAEEQKMLEKMEQIYTKCQTGLGSLGTLASKAPGASSPGNKDDIVNESNDKFQVSKENLSLNLKQTPFEHVAEHLQHQLDQPHLLFHGGPGSAPLGYGPPSTTSKTIETSLSRPAGANTVQSTLASLPDQLPDSRNYWYPIHNFYPQKPKTEKSTTITCQKILSRLPQ